MALTSDSAARAGERSPLDAIFSPHSVAVLGTTPTPGTVPYDVFHNILTSGYHGTLYPVAPGKSHICCIRAYRYVVDIPDDVDLAVIVYPASAVDRGLEQCGKKGIKAAVVISAGFREVGPAGAEREEHIKAICREYGIALIGPNCLGVINTDPNVRLNASFARKMPDQGRIAFLSQSGALCTAVLDYARDKAIGFSKFVSFGNKAGVSEVELMQYLHKDPQTDVILLYLEELSAGRRLLDAARKITRGPGAKPILVIKSGRTEQGAKAAASHTGSLASSDAVSDDLLPEAGIVRVNSIEELFNSAILYANQPMPKGDRLAIVTNAGGPGVMATDAAVRSGLTITRFEESTRTKLRGFLPAAANVHNPVDVIGDARADRYAGAMDAVLADPNVDQVLVILTPQSMTDIDSIAHAVCDVKTRTEKPIACSFMGAHDVAAGVHILQAKNIPHYILPEWACRAMADVQRIRRWREGCDSVIERLSVDKPAAAAIIDRSGEGYLPEDLALAVADAYGLPVPRFRMCTSVQEACAFADRAGYPATLRVVSRQVIHKTEAGGVALNLGDASAVAAAWKSITEGVSAAVPNARIDGMLCRQMIPAGHELILGVERDRAFGPVLMFGLGGIYVEIFSDVTFAAAPIARADADAMLHRVKAWTLLAGARGAKAINTQAVEECIVRLGQLAADFERIAELDINPLIVGPAGPMIADVRIRLS